MSTFEIVMGILGLAGGAMDLSGHINNTSKLIKLEKQLLNAENHIQLLEFGGIGSAVLSLLITLVQSKLISDNTTALNDLRRTKADQATVDNLADKINRIENLKADKTSVDAINANVKMLSSMMHNRMM